MSGTTSGGAGISICRDYGGCSNNIINNNTFQFNTYGISGYNSFNNTLANNIFHNNNYGIRLTNYFPPYNGNSRIIGNLFYNNGGIEIFSSANNTISLNNLQKSSITLQGSDNTSVIRNTITADYEDFQSDGIRVYDSNNIILQDNEILGVYWSGISLNGVSRSFILNNTIITHDYGIDAISSRNNIIALNTFDSYFKPRSDVSSLNIWNTTVPMNYIFNGSSYAGFLGNYWSPYFGTDTDDNGIGDQALAIGSYGDKDNYPLMGQWTGSSITNYSAHFTPTPTPTLAPTPLPTGIPVPTKTPTPIYYSLIDIYPGWNFISTPRKLVTGNDTTLIFKDVNTVGHTIWQYDAQVKQWKAMGATTKVNTLDGVWVYSNKTIDVPLWFNQDPIGAPPEKQVYAGWNAIGFSDTTPLSAKSTLTSINPGWAQMIGYDAVTQGYEVSIINGDTGSHSDSREMLPTKGYWLFMVNNGTLAAISA